MQRIEELKEKLVSVINRNSEFDHVEKETWSEIISELADYQDNVLKGIATPSFSIKKNMNVIHSGITSMNKDLLGNNYHYISISDEPENPDFPYGKIDSCETDHMDGDWFIIGTGYMDCEYSKVLELCGREHRYKGKDKDGEFEYSLVLKNNILHHEKVFNKIEKYYNIDDAVMYAPMLRRLVYVETRSKVSKSIGESDLQLEKNGLSCFKYRWRAIWNVECSDVLYMTKTYDGYKLEKNQSSEYIVPRVSDGRLQIKPVYDNKTEKDYVHVSAYNSEEPKKYIQKICILESGIEKNIYEDNIIICFTPKSKENSVTRIYSKSDVMEFLKQYKSFIICEDVFTKYIEEFFVCTYERGFEYPSDTESFIFSGRPVLYVKFKKEDDRLFFDRVVYMTYILQKRFPEYIWKGGFMYE